MNKKRQRPGNLIGRKPGRKQRKIRLLSEYYNRPGDVATLKKIAYESNIRIVQTIALGFADRLECGKGAL
jgi:hypothetical protein